MTIEFARKLLALFGAVTADGGDQVVRQLTEALAQVTPFDQGELLLTLVADVHRRPLGTSSACLAEDDLLQHLVEHPGPFRIDRVSEMKVLPRTRARLAEGRHQSLLALPIVPDATLRGAVALAARRPCAFAAVPLQGLTTLASAAGLALLQSLKLTGLHDEQESLKATLHERTEQLGRVQQELERLAAPGAAGAGERATGDAALEGDSGATPSEPAGRERASRRDRRTDGAPPSEGSRRPRHRPESS
jgi:transcriptional regulator with GAF, ATPase, and Fis domain